MRNAPIGTKAPAIGGGWWYKTKHGWKWNGPGGSGSTFPRPGGDWDGRLVTTRLLLWEQGNPAHFAAWWIEAGELVTASREEVLAIDPRRMVNGQHPSRYGFKTYYSATVYQVLEENEHANERAN